VNCVGRAGTRVARYPSLGWETGDWGGAEALGREALFAAARAKDGRGEPTALVRLIQDRFGMCVEGIGEATHYRRMPSTRLGELAAGIVEAAASDGVARALVERLADELVLLVERALRDLGLVEADVVLGGGMLRDGALLELVLSRLPAGARPVVLREPPVLGAALAALDLAGAANGAHARLRQAFAEGPVPDAG
jgi:N-acetylglucosamine kinase-like BadF-type ATPase